MRKKAVVFDVSGTLLRRCRAVMSINTDKQFKKNSLEMVDELGNSALAILQTNTKKTVMSADPEQKLYDFLKDNKIDVYISYSSTKITLEELTDKIKQDPIKMKYFQDVARSLSNEHDFIEICSGSAFIYNASSNKIEYIIAAGGQLFPKAADVIETLKNRNIESYIASGDREKSLKEIGKKIKIPDANIFDTVDEFGKEEIIKSLKKENYKVMMVGNGPNDVLAFKQADVSVITLEQGDFMPKNLCNEADIIINHISDVLDIDF